MPCRVWGLRAVCTESGVGSGADKRLEERRNRVDPVDIPSHHAGRQPDQPLPPHHLLSKVQQVSLALVPCALGLNDTWYVLLQFHSSSLFWFSVQL